MIETRNIEFKTKGAGDIIDITPKIQEAVRKSSIGSGVVTAFVPGSTAGLTTIEYEPGGCLRTCHSLWRRLYPLIVHTSMMKRGMTATVFRIFGQP